MFASGQTHAKVVGHEVGSPCQLCIHVRTKAQGYRSLHPTMRK